MPIAPPLPGIDLAKDRCQRVRQVADIRVETDRREKARLDRIHASEELEVFENVERQWNEEGQGFGCDFFGGIGEGKTGSRGTYVFRAGAMVPQNDADHAAGNVDHGRDSSFAGIGERHEGFGGAYRYDKFQRAWVRK